MAKRRSSTQRTEEQRQAARAKRDRQNSNRKRRREAKREGLQLTWWAITAVVVYLCLMAVRIAWNIGDSFPLEDVATGIAVWFLISSVVIAVPTLIIWFGSNSKLASNITCVSMAGTLLVALVLPVFSTPKPDNETVSDAGDATVVASDSTYAKAEDEDEVHDKAINRLLSDRTNLQLVAWTAAGASDADDAAARLDALADSAERFGRGATGDDRALIEIAAMLRAYSPLYARFARYYTQYLNNGGLSPATLQTKELVNERLAIIDELIQATRDVHEFLLAQKEGLPQQLMRAGFSEVDANRIAGWWMDASRWSYALPLRYHERHMLSHQREAIELMGNSMGYWNVDGAGVIQFIDLPEQLAHQKIVRKMDLTMQNYHPIHANLDLSLRSNKAVLLAPAPEPKAPAAPVVCEPELKPTPPQPEPKPEPEPKPVVAVLAAPPEFSLHEAELSSRILKHYTEYEAALGAMQAKDEQAKQIIERLLVVSQAIRESTARYYEAKAAYESAGGVKPATLADEQAVKDRVELMDSVYKWLVRLDGKHSMDGQQLRRELEAMELDADRINSIIGGWNTHFLNLQCDALHEAEGRLISKHRAILKALRSSRDRWHPTEDGQYAFESDYHVRKLTRLVNEFPEDIKAVTQKRAELSDYFEMNKRPVLPEGINP